MKSQYRFETISVRQASPDAPVEATFSRFDPSSSRMVFVHLAALVGDLGRELDAADLLAYAAQIYSARVAEQHRLMAHEAPTGG